MSVSNTESLKLKIDNHYEIIPVVNLFWMIHFNNHRFSKSQLNRIHSAFSEHMTTIKSLKNASLDAYDEDDWNQINISVTR